MKAGTKPGLEGQRLTRFRKEGGAAVAVLSLTYYYKWTTATEKILKLCAAWACSKYPLLRMALRRIFGIRFVFFLAFGLFVVFLQMLALSRLGPQPTVSQFPWEDNQGIKREQRSSLTHVSLLQAGCVVFFVLLHCILYHCIKFISL